MDTIKALTALHEAYDTVVEKNRKYGDSFAKAALELLIMFPNGVKPDEYGKFLFLGRLFDKMNRLASAQADEDEDINLDILGYALLNYVNNLEGEGE